MTGPSPRRSVHQPLGAPVGRSAFVLLSSLIGWLGALLPIAFAATYHGEADLRFNPPIFSGNDAPYQFARAVEVTTDGRIWVGGSFSELNRKESPGIVRLLPSGDIDTSVTGPLLPGGRRTSSIYDLHLDRSNRLFVIGATGSTNIPSILYAAWKLLADGGMDPSFAPVRADGRAIGSVVLPDGGLLITGDFLQINEVPRPKVAKILPSGQLDLQFNVHSNFSKGVGLSAAVDSGGHIYVGGDFSGAGYGGVVRLRSDGTLDPEFKSVLQSRSSVEEIYPLPDGKILVGGALSVGGQSQYLLRLNSSGAADPTFSATAGFFKGSVTCIRGTTDGSIWIGSRSYVLGARAAGPIARLTSEGNFDDSLITSASFPVGPLVRGLAVTDQGDAFIGGQLLKLGDTVGSCLTKFQVGPTSSTNRPGHQATVSPGFLYAHEGESVALTASSSLFGTLRYQWMKNGLPLLRETNSVLALPELTKSDEANYAAWVTDGTTSAISFPAHVVVMVTSFSIPDIGEPDRKWVRWPGAEWKPQSSNVQSGSSALSCPAVRLGLPGNLETVITGPGTVTFWDSVRKSSSGDAFVTYGYGIDDEMQSMSSGFGWRRVTRFVGSGRHVIRWYFANSFLGNAFDPGDAAYMDSFSFTPSSPAAPVVMVAPRSVTVERGTNARFDVIVQSASPVTYQWFKNRAPIPTGRRARLSLANVDDSEAGEYSVAISNATGTTRPEPVLLALVDSSPRPTLRISPTRGTGEVGLQIAGEPGAPVELQTSTDLIQWNPLRSFLLEIEPTEVREWVPLEPIRRFYRAVR